MRSLFLVLVLANALLFAAQFATVRDLIWTSPLPARAPQLNAERLRVIRDTSVTPRPATPPPSASPGPATPG
jgi:hypothetical protein